MWALVVIMGLFAVGMLVTVPSSSAHIETTTLDDSFSMEKITTTMTIPENNTLPWGHVYGSVNNHADGYPVIIQIYQGDDPVHFAQTEVNNDGTYDYQFRVRNVVDNQTINVFEGDYTVMIFKVVQNTHADSLA
ncbi:MAG: hypothetical protein OXC46_00335 [Thaumarchaeota archaeon]|nr:hypothetical protein [Nitrososphaerota archaeon]